MSGGALLHESPANTRNSGLVIRSGPNLASEDAPQGTELEKRGKANEGGSVTHSYTESDPNVPRLRGTFDPGGTRCTFQVLPHPKEPLRGS